MKHLFRGAVGLGVAFVAAATMDGCGDGARDFADAGMSGDSGEGGVPTGGSGAVAGGGGAAEAAANTGSGGADANTAGGMSGEGGAAGADCEACACTVGDQRSCASAGLLGSCAAGTQTCSADRQWGSCSIQAKNKDTCEAGNDDTCNGVANEGCPCVDGQQRPCSDGGLVGKCATGKQTCGAGATWGACSILPAAADTCVLNNNDNCSGAANEGCLCIEGVTTRPCGVCADGTQTCTNGKTAQYGACVGGTTMKTYYLDADGDGHAVNVSTTVCGPAPAHYITGPVDDCYDSNKDVFPGQTGEFTVQRGDGSFDYNCNNVEEPSAKQGDVLGCSVCASDCTCATPGHFVTTPACGAGIGGGACCIENGVCTMCGFSATQSCR